MLRLLRGKGDEHTWVRENLSAFYDRALSSGDAGRVERHLAECREGCPAEFESLRVTAAAVRALPELRAPRSFALTARDVTRPVPIRPAPDRSRGFWGSQRGMEFGAMAAAVLLVAVLVGDAITKPAGEPIQAPQTVGAASDDAMRNGTVPEGTAGEVPFTTEAAPDSTTGPSGDLSPSSKTPATEFVEAPVETPGPNEPTMTMPMDGDATEFTTASGATDLAPAPEAPDDERTWLVVLQVTAGSVLALLVLLAIQNRFGNKNEIPGVR